MARHERRRHRKRRRPDDDGPEQCRDNGVCAVRFIYSQRVVIGHFYRDPVTGVDTPATIPTTARSLTSLQSQPAVHPKCRAIDSGERPRGSPWRVKPHLATRREYRTKDNVFAELHIKRLAANGDVTTKAGAETTMERSSDVSAA